MITIMITILSILYLRIKRIVKTYKERVAEEMPISEVRKCSRLLTPVHSLIDQHASRYNSLSLEDITTKVIHINSNILLYNMSSL